ncbi:MAG: hypothetical protein IKR73_08525 [Oscillospiraceae bacterium]|nr:hypothetical protein [Oscillospiraceae bacterium]
MTLTRRQMIKGAVISFVIAGLLLFSFVGYIGSWEIFCRDPVAVTAVVTGNERYPHGRGSGKDKYLPYVEYECRGKSYRIKYYEGRNYSPLPEGYIMTFMVDGSDPTKVLEEPDVRVFVGAVLSMVTLAMGTAFVIELRKTPDEQGGAY